MKKVLASFALMALACALFADDALVLPQGVLRASLSNTYAFFDEAYDDDGDPTDYTETKLYIIGTALELGLTDQINLGLQWAPAAIVWSDIDTDHAEYTGLRQLFVGFKIQALGDQGFVPDEKMRLAIAPGFRVPLQKYDVEEELTNQSTGKDFLIDSVDSEAFGVGGRLHFDYIFSDVFYLNFYSQMIYNFPVDRNLSLTNASIVYAASGSLANATKDYKHEYGFDYFFELDPHYELPLTEKSDLIFKVPVRYTFTPGVEIDSAYSSNINGDDAYLLTITPEIGYFSREGTLPWKASLYYNIPVIGENTKKKNSITLLLRLYAKVF
jgi:hypothetical protein